MYKNKGKGEEYCMEYEPQKALKEIQSAKG